MYKQIVVPLDGSEQAEQAIGVAARVARHEGAALTLVQVVTAEAARGGDAVPVRVGELTERDDRRSAAEYLQRAAQHPELAGVPTETVVRDGSPAEQIEAEAARRRADLIVLSHRQHGPGASFFLGSVADALIRHAQIPILVLDSDNAVGLGGASTTAAARPVRALVPLDGSRPAEQAIPRAIELLRALETGRGATIHLTYVMDPKQAFKYDTPETEALHRARAYLETTAERVAADPANISITVSWAVETDTNVVTGLERVAEQGAYGRADHFDFAAMTTHGREGIVRWLAGSVTEGLVHGARVPVLIIHPPHGVPETGSTPRHAQAATGEAPWPPLF